MINGPSDYFYNDFIDLLCQISRSEVGSMAPDNRYVLIWDLGHSHRADALKMLREHDILELRAMRDRLRLFFHIPSKGYIIGTRENKEVGEMVRELTYILAP
jgi:hypothetical protein